MRKKGGELEWLIGLLYHNSIQEIMAYISLHEWVRYIFPYMFMVDFYAFHVGKYTIVPWMGMVNYATLLAFTLCFPNGLGAPIFLGSEGDQPWWFSTKMKLTINSKMLSHALGMFQLTECPVFFCWDVF